MSLLTSHSATNLVIDQALVVAYATRRVNGSWSQGSTMGIDVASYDHMYELTRSARQSFRYVGMTKSAASTCKSAMVAKYTRTQKVSEWDGFNGMWTHVSGGSIPMAEVSMSHNDDGSYDVVVNVNELDTRMSLTGSEFAIATLFDGERRREYEGGESEDPESEGD